MRFTFRQYERLLALALICLACILLLVFFQDVKPVARITGAMRGSLHAAGLAISTVVEHIFYSKSELLRDNQRLREQVVALAEEASRAAILEQQNAALASLIAYQQRESIDLIPAVVVSRSHVANSEMLMLDRGASDGLEVGQAVIAGEGFLIGVIESVAPATAVVRLVTDQQSKIGVRMLNDAATIGIIEGQGGELLRIDFIPQSVDLVVDELVLTSGLDPGIPHGLILGTIADVMTDEHSPFQQAFVAPLIDLRRLSIVGVLNLAL